MKRAGESSSSDPTGGSKKRVRINIDSNVEHSASDNNSFEGEDPDIDLLETHKSNRKSFTNIDSDSDSDSSEKDEKEPEFLKPAVPENDVEQQDLSIPTHENVGNIPIIPYSMKADMEEGDIDEQGHYIKRTLRAEDADANLVHDSWLSGISQVRDTYFLFR
jgi:hypothetical protein